MKKTMKILALVLAALMMMSLLAACGGGESGGSNTPAQSPASSAPAPAASPDVGGGLVGAVATEGAKYKEDITIIVDTQPSTLNRFLAGSNDNTARWSMVMFSDRLIDNVGGEFVPMLATEWSTDDYKTFTFKLRDDVVFHNGEKFTADDVVYTWERAREAVGTEVYDNIGRGLDKIEAVSDTEVKITLSDVDVDDFIKVSVPSAGIANRKAGEADAENGDLVGTGPWVVKNFLSGQSVELTRNDNYWGEIPKTKNIKLLCIGEQGTRMLMLENGEVEVAFGTNFYSDYPVLENDDRFQAFPYIANNPAYIGFNMNDPVTGDLNFRKAVISCIDRETMAAVSRSGYAIPILDKGNFWGYQTLYENTDIPVIPYDLEAAKEYLAKSNYNGEEVSILCALDNFLSDAPLLQEQLIKIGVNAVVKQVDLPTIRAMTAYDNNSAQIIAHTGNWTLDPSCVLGWYGVGGANNKASYHNEEVCKLIEEAATMTDTAQREAAYKRIQELAAEDLPFVATYYIQHVIGALQGVGGIRLESTTYHNLSYVYMIEE